MLNNKIMKFQQKRIEHLESENEKYKAACYVLYKQLEIERAIIAELKKNNTERESVIAKREKELTAEFEKLQKVKNDFANALTEIIQAKDILRGGE